MAAIGFNRDVIDHDCIPIPKVPWENPISLDRRGIGLGDETFAIGLFKNHAGKERNIPIIRIGNIAAFPEEPVHTRWGHMKAYLLETRSIAGLSGSPVFVNRPMSTPIGFMPDPRVQQNPEEINWVRYRFLGLISAHFDVPNLREDTVTEDDEATGSINTGIGIVIPAEKIVETLYQDALVDEMCKLEANAGSGAASKSDEKSGPA